MILLDISNNKKRSKQIITVFVDFIIPIIEYLIL